jgi:hypothetical protein
MPVWEDVPSARKSYYVTALRKRQGHGRGKQFKTSEIVNKKGRDPPGIPALTANRETITETRRSIW